MIRAIVTALITPTVPGFVRIGTTANGRAILDVSLPFDLPPGLTKVSEGVGRFGRDVLGTVADRVLEATWEDTDEEGNPVIRRGKVADAPAVVLETDLRPHRWLGEP